MWALLLNNCSACLCLSSSPLPPPLFLAIAFWLCGRRERSPLSTETEEFSPFIRDDKKGEVPLSLSCLSGTTLRQTAKKIRSFIHQNIAGDQSLLFLTLIFYSQFPKSTSTANRPEISLWSVGSTSQKTYGDHRRLFSQGAYKIVFLCTFGLCIVSVLAVTLFPTLVITPLCSSLLRLFRFTCTEHALLAVGLLQHFRPPERRTRIGAGKKGRDTTCVRFSLPARFFLLCDFATPFRRCQVAWRDG